MPDTALCPGQTNRKRPLLLYLVTIVTLAFGGQMIAVSVGWQMYALTKSAFYLGLVGLIQFIPMIVMTLFAGYIADHFDRKVIVCLSGAGLCACYLFLGVSSYLGVLRAGSLLAAAFAVGALNALNGPSLQSLLPNIVPKAQLTKATASKTSCFQAATIIGPALGGFLYAAGAHIVYFVSAAIVLAGCTAILGVRVAARQTDAARKTDAAGEADAVSGTDSRSVSAGALFAGVRYIREHPVVLGAISLDLFAVLFGGATALLPIFASSILHTGAFGLGVLRSAPAFGAFLVSFYLARRPFTHHVGVTMFAAVAVFGLATVWFALSRSLTMSFIALLVLGAADVVSVVVRSTLVQLQTPNAMLGRVNSINQLFIGTSNQLGEFESGLTAAWFGAMPAALLGGIGTICIVFVWMKLFPPLRRMDTYEDPAPDGLQLSQEPH